MYRNERLGDADMNGNNFKGFTLVELMITVAIIGVLAGIAVPAYNNYIATSKTGTALANANSLSGFVEAYFYENDNTYPTGDYIPGGDISLAALLDWAPSGDKDRYKYSVTVGPCGDITKCYTITVTGVIDTNITASISRP